MPDAVFDLYKRTLPDDLSALLAARIEALEKAEFQACFEEPLVKALLGHAVLHDADERSASGEDWNDFIFNRLERLLSNREEYLNNESHDDPTQRQHLFFLTAVAALLAFTQSNVTGPPLEFSPAKLLFPPRIADDRSSLASARERLVKSLTIDGVAAYRLIPNIELFCLASTILTCPAIKKNVSASAWFRLRIDFIHQKLLSETSPTLQTIIYNEHIPSIDLLSRSSSSLADTTAQWLLEKAAIHIHHGFDKLARANIENATQAQRFEFTLTGLLGKRTKYQVNETSQLVVLAKSHDHMSSEPRKEEGNGYPVRPENLDLNDDTLLEAISFTANGHIPTTGTKGELPPSLSALDPADQPLLKPLDSVILLSLASSITNTSPADGLTREETLPYATRVLDGGSSNWQIYTQALLVRSRIEGYRSRTIERGLLQLQTLVDQVIAETGTSGEVAANEDSVPTTFLSKPKPSESAPAAERLAYIFQLNSPTRWDLEAELAARWVSLGGLRSALEIYERLQMWAEAALCYAGVDREDKARKIVRHQLFHATSGLDESADAETETWQGAARDPPPADAPRLYCILGDIDRDLAMYEKGWEVSNKRYARAQRSLGRHYLAINDHIHAAAAYSKALTVNQLNQQSWFALGCALLELSEFSRAAEAFSRTVQLDDSDAEAWSNLAAALLRLPPDATPTTQALLDDEDADVNSTPRKPDAQRHRRDALVALRRAAGLKRDSYRIWDNLLTVAASLAPPAYTDIVTAQRQVISLRGAKDGELCVDADILALLVRHLVSSTNADGTPVYTPGQPGLARLVCELVDAHVVPLITASRPLWQVVATLALWRGRPGSALEATEKAWRAATAQVGWEAGPVGGTATTSPLWDEVVDASVELADAYESLGGRERTEGLAAGSGELVARDWRFKARSVVRGVMARAKAGWEGSEGWERLVKAMEGLKGQ